MASAESTPPDRLDIEKGDYPPSAVIEVKKAEDKVKKTYDPLLKGALEQGVPIGKGRRTRKHKRVHKKTHKRRGRK